MKKKEENIRKISFLEDRIEQAGKGLLVWSIPNGNIYFPLSATEKERLINIFRDMIKRLENE